jgi:thiosulfate dehydrogenase
MLGSRHAAIPLAGLLIAAACAPQSKPSASAPPGKDSTHGAAFDEASWHPLTEKDIPSDSLGASIRRGLYLIRFTNESLPKNDPSNLRCVSCHLNDGTKPEAAPLTGSHARFPKYMPRTGAVIDLAERVNYCFTRSLAGYAIPKNSREMQDILAYIYFISKGVPVGYKLKGADGLISTPDTLEADTTRGRETFAKKCQVCHGANGEGAVAPAPALWGPKSFSIGASMARRERAASFISHNMPFNAPGTLTLQEAFDLSAFINSHPRPDSPGKEKDYPAGGAAADTPYDTYGHKAFSPPPKLISRPNPNGTAEVPAPASVRKTK